MTTTNVEVSKDLPKPGTIIRMQAFSSKQQDLFGFAISLNFFDSHASEKAKQKFYDTSSVPEWDLLIPAFVMEEDLSWSIRFRQRHHSTVLVSILDVNEALKNCLKIMNCFTHRDGSRYYSWFMDKIYFYSGFIYGHEKIEDFPHFKQNPLEEKFLRSLIKWKDDNVVSRLSSEGELFEVVSDDGDDTRARF